MKSIKFTTSSILRRINDRLRLAPSQLYEDTDCLWLVLIDGQLLCPKTRKQARLELTESELREGARLDRLAESARQLVETSERPIGLLLPLSQFLYSHYSVPLGDQFLGDGEMVRSAIALQKDILLPAFEQEFALGAAAGRSEGVAFWFPETTLRALEAAFAAAALELVAVLPRAVAAGQAAGSVDRTADSYVVADRDAASYSVLRFEGGVATEVVSAYAGEFENADIRQSWEEQTAPLLEQASVSLSSADDWLGLRDLKPGASDYLFYSRPFLKQVADRNRQRRIYAGAAAGVAAMLVLSLPFVYLWADSLRLERARDAFREQARVAERYQNEMLDLEYEWGVVYEYPEPDVAGILTGLNTVIDNSLTSFQLTNARVEIQGFTQDPEQLTRLLLQQPLFATIEQSRSISDSNTGRGDRFGLRITLADLDFAEYSRKYDFR